jgi:hypothetical protein
MKSERRRGAALSKTLVARGEREIDRERERADRRERERERSEGRERERESFPDGWNLASKNNDERLHQNLASVMQECVELAHQT